MLVNPKRKLNEDTWDSQKPGILGICSRVRLGLRQLKGACQGTQRTKANVSHQPPNDAKKGQKTWEPATHEKRFGTSGNPKRWTLQEGD